MAFRAVKPKHPTQAYKVSQQGSFKTSNMELKWLLHPFSHVKA